MDAEEFGGGIFADGNADLIAGYYINLNEQQAISDEGKSSERDKALPAWQGDDAEDESQNCSNRRGKEQRTSRVAEDKSVLAANECYQY